MRVLACGGRDFRDYTMHDKALDLLHSRRPVTCLIHGGAAGADALSGAWAEERGIQVLVFYADWDKHGRAAGHLRNRRMLMEGHPELVVAFPGGRGTANMIENATKEGTKVWQPYARRQGT
jgi:hypothetical protein